MNITIHQANAKDAAIIAPLFDAYRVWYQQPADAEGALLFIKERLQQNETVVFIAYINNEAVGFVQMYPIFSSVGMRKALLLNDLFVEDTSRGNGVGKALLQTAKDFAKKENYQWLLLQTGRENYNAQLLYERDGWKKESDYFYKFEV